MRRGLWSLAAVVVFALIVSGCAGASAGSGSGNGNATTVPAAGSGTSAVTTAAGGSAGTTVDATATVYQQALKFAACMRANGVSQFPDPAASGSFTIDAIANGSSLDTNSPAFKQAINACRTLEPPGFTGSQRTPAQQQAALEFAQCVRDHGVSDFPDPASDGPLVDTRRIPSAATGNGKSLLRAAMQQCREYMTAAGVTGGQ